MPPSPRTRGVLYAKISSIVEGSFLDNDDAISINASSHVGASPRIGRSLRSGRSPHIKQLGQRTNLISQVVPNQAVTESIRTREPTTDRPIISFIVIYTMIFFNGCCFTAVVPSVPFYLHYLGAPPTFLGLVVSAYSLGQIIGSPISGWLNDHLQSRTLLTLSSCIGLIASTFYATAPNQWYILLSRVMTGISAGMEFTTELAFIARNTTNEERTTYLASVSAVNILGFIMGPALTTVLSMLDFEFMGFKVNEYTGPGWLLVMMFFIDVLMIRIIYEDSSVDDAEDSDESTAWLLENEEKEGMPSYGAVSNDGEIEHMENGTTKHKSKQEPEPPSLFLVLGLIFTQFTLMCAWSVLETITSPLASDSFGWSVEECNLLFTCGGAASLLAYVSFVIASKWVEDRWLIVYAITTCFVGLLLMIHLTLDFLPSYKYCFLAGYLIMNAGFMTGRPVTFALYSKLIPTQYQGKYLGFMVAGGSVARTLGPFVAVYLYYHIEGPWKNTLALFGSEGVIMVMCLALMIYLWPSLLPSKTVKQDAGNKPIRSHERGPDGPSSPYRSADGGDISVHIFGRHLSQ